MLLLLLLPLVWASEWVGAARAGPARAPPGSPKEGAQPELHMQLPVTVQEGLCVHVPCTFSYHWGNQTDWSPVFGHWFRKGPPDILVATSKPDKKVKKSNKLLFHLGDPAAGSCALNITHPRREDSGTYYFQVERGKTKHNYTLSGQMLTVRVTALTQAPDITMEQPLEAGRPSRLTCSLPWACDGAPAPISWTGAALGAQGLGPAPYASPELLLTPRPQDHGTELKCRVDLPRPSVRRARTLMLNVSYAPQNLSVRLFRGHGAEPKYLGNGSSLSVLEGESLHLLCAVDSNPPSRLSWDLGRGAPSPSQPSSPGVLELPQVELGHEGEFTCHAQHPRGSLHVSLHLSVQTPPQLLGPSCSPEEDEGLLCSCSAQARPAPSLHWRVGEQLLEGNSSNASVQVTFSPSGLWANSSLRLSGGLSAALRLSCEAQNPQGTHSAVLLLLPGRAGKPGLGREFVLGAIGGAGVAGLLALCPALVYFLVKTCKKGAREKAAGQAAAPSTPVPTSWGHQLECQPGGAMDGPVPGPREAEEQELHYTSVSFLSLRPRQPPDQDATSTTEYSEIMTHK